MSEVNENLEKSRKTRPLVYDKIISMKISGKEKKLWLQRAKKLKINSLSAYIKMIVNRDAYRK